MGVSACIQLIHIPISLRNYRVNIVEEKRIGYVVCNVGRCIFSHGVGDVKRVEGGLLHNTAYACCRFFFYHSFEKGTTHFLKVISYTFRIVPQYTRPMQSTSGLQVRITCNALNCPIAASVQQRSVSGAPDEP